MYDVRRIPYLPGHDYGVATCRYAASATRRRTGGGLGKCDRRREIESWTQKDTKYVGRMVFGDIHTLPPDVMPSLGAVDALSLDCRFIKH